MKLFCLMALCVSGVTACKTDITNDNAEPVIFSEQNPACVKEQMKAVQKLGLSLKGDISELLTFLLAGKDEKRLPICTEI